MKIFGLQIGKSKKEEVIEDKVPEVKAVIPDNKKVALIPRVRDPVMGYHSSRRTGRGYFRSSEYDLAELGRIVDTDSYVRQAFSKKIALMFKEGWDIVGSNPKTIKYIKERFNQIARASNVPVSFLLREIGSGLIQKSNCFLLKIRKTEASGGKIRKDPNSSTPLKPIAAYFIIPAETMEFEMSGNRVTRWQQRMPDGEMKKFPPRDIIHFFFERKEGFIFGTPLLTPVIDDIRALRKIEENIELLVYQHLFPLFQYVVGTENQPAAVDERGRDEIDVVRREIQYMPSEGGIVTSHRHEIKAIGAEGRALRAEGYLEHFKRRVFSGLGLSAVDFGEGDTANRATSDNMSRNLIDSVKNIQQIVETFVNEYMINELLLESTFGDDVLSEENRCYLKFKEIDIDAQIKRETHAADQFNKDIITWPEARMRNGYEPIIVPSPEEIDNGQDTAEKYPDWHQTRWKLFELPKLLIQSLDEPYSLLSKALARDSSVSATQGDFDEAGEKQLEKEIALQKTKASQTRPSESQTSTRKAVQNGYLAEVYNQIKSNVVIEISVNQKVDHDWIAAQVRASMNPISKRLLVDQIVAFQKSYGLYMPVGDETFIHNMDKARRFFEERSEKYIFRLTEDIVNNLKRNVPAFIEDNPIPKVKVIFEALEYRTHFIEDVEVRKASNLGHILGQAAKKQAFFLLTSTTSTEACDRCLMKSKHIIDLAFSHEGKINLHILDLDDIPPFHANCGCVFNLVKNIEEPIADSATDPTGFVEETQFSECPKCGNTALKNQNTLNSYKCKKCGHSFNKDEKIEDVDKMERCVLKVKKQLRQKNPNWDDDKIKSSAHAICTAQLKGK